MALIATETKEAIGAMITNSFQRHNALSEAPTGAIKNRI